LKTEFNAVSRLSIFSINKIKKLSLIYSAGQDHYSRRVYYLNILSRVVIFFLFKILYTAEVENYKILKTSSFLLPIAVAAAQQV